MGCDHVLWSGKFRDRCGVCDGNGDSCSGIKSSYTKVLHKYGNDFPILHIHQLLSRATINKNAVLRSFEDLHTYPVV